MGVRTANILYLLMSLIEAIQDALHLVKHVLEEAGHLLHLWVLLSCSLPRLDLLSRLLEQLLKIIDSHDIALQFLCDHL